MSIGQGRPISRRRECARWTIVSIAAAALVAWSHCAHAAELDVRLRFAWGSGGQSPQKWTGQITIADGALANLQPLGIEADEAAAVRLADNRVQVAPLVRRAFDGCDINVRADETAIVSIELQTSSSSGPKRVEVPLGQLAEKQYRAPLDDLGSYLLVDRAPGEKLRVQIDRDHLVFDPGEAIELKLSPDLKTEAANSAITIAATLYQTGGSDALWQTSKPYDADSSEPMALSLTAPQEEGAYRVTILAKWPEGLTDRLVPWEKQAPIALREVEFVVVDPARRLPRLLDKWETVATVDPANTSWWQRLPHLSQFDKLPGFSTPRPLGNVKPSPVVGAEGRFVQLPATTAGDEPAWQAYLLPVRRVGQPHAVEIELPQGPGQHLAVSIIEPDAAGRVLSFGRDGGVYSQQRSETSAGETIDKHRIVFWPRTRTPALLLANLSKDRPAQYGKIKLQLRAVDEAPAVVEDAADAVNSPQRLVAAYLATPRFAETLGGNEEVDPASGLSVDGWHAFLTGASRLAQELRSAGFNAAIISIAADGSSLAPIDALGASPRYDSGLLASSGPDPMRKDVLEVLLRVFDREGLRLIPTLQLATPLPALESLRSQAQSAGDAGSLAWIGHDGRPWREHFPTDSAEAPHYNLLNSQVQSGVADAAEQLLARYENHSSFAGLGLQLSGNGYGVLPGLAWGMDDATIERFAANAKLALPQDGADRFQKRAAALLGPHRAAWSKWRQDEVTRFYAEIASRLARRRSDLQLVLCTEDLFTGSEAAERVRQAVTGPASLSDALAEIGVDPARLAATPNITFLRPRRLTADHSIEAQAPELRINAAPELDRAFAAQPRSGELFFHTAARLRLPSFDSQSPFGADRTYLSLASVAVLAGDAARQPLVAALAQRDFVTLAAGAETFPLNENESEIAARRAFQELPLAGADVRTERHEPITIRIYREAESTAICLLNESPWPVDVRLPLECDATAVWRQLGSDTTAKASEQTTGTLAAGAQAWNLTLPPYGLAARRYSSRTMRVGAFEPRVAAQAKEALARRLADVELRMQSLDIERPYNELQNPQFELVTEDNRLMGWQPRGPATNVEVSDATPGATGRAVHLLSDNPLGVAIQSHMFPIPDTGQLVVRAKVRLKGGTPQTRIYAWVEYEADGAMRQKPLLLTGDGPLTAEWTDCEIAVDDLPWGAGQMRLQFHLAGPGEAWIDDVRLYDLRFTLAQRRELAKRLYAAKSAFEEGQLMDCQREIEGYLPRRLVEHVPAASLAAKPADAPPAAAAKEDAKGLGPRFRGMVPRILR